MARSSRLFGYAWQKRAKTSRFPGLVLIVGRHVVLFRVSLEPKLSSKLCNPGASLRLQDPLPITPIVTIKVMMRRKGDADVRAIGGNWADCDRRNSPFRLDPSYKSADATTLDRIGRTIR